MVHVGDDAEISDVRSHRRGEVYPIFSAPHHSTLMSNAAVFPSAIIPMMILVTGGTGFVGRALIRQLVSAGYHVRTLIRPSPRTPRLPRGVPVEVAVTGLSDIRGLRAALREVDIVIHLAGSESQGARATLLDTDVRGTRNLAQVAAEAGVRHFLFLSHLDADRASAFPVLKAKGIAEEYIRRSGVPYTIFRSAIVFGPGDHFTTALAHLLRLAPGIFPLPNGGKTLLQPLWIEDLTACFLWALEEPTAINQTYEIGGSERFTLREVVEILLSVTRRRRLLVSLPLPLLRAFVMVVETFFPSIPASTLWLDYLAVNRTCPIDTLPRVIGLMPARFAYRLDYLIPKPWYLRLRDALIVQGRKARHSFRTAWQKMRKQE
ncbi:MAG: NAD-dependent epimerase/dehydratase family protein [Anaerolineae bacterium]|nr:MAG: NAD-dependent epimerase/dehydratase family protein [Anaerolineae bacterium]